MGCVRVSALWRRQPLVVRRAVLALPIAGLLLGLAWSGVLRRSPEVYILVAAVLALFLARSAYAGFWLGLDRAGLGDARDQNLSIRAISL